MTLDIQYRICKNCNKKGMRVNSGTYTKKTDKRWIGEDGRQWCGLKCPDCHAAAARVNMRRLRTERKANGPAENK